MNHRFDPRLVGRLRLFSSIAAVLAAAIGLSVLAGWILDLTVLLSWGPGMATAPNAAACFVLGGLALGLLGTENSPVAPVSRLIAKVLAAVISLAALLSLAEHLFHLNLGIDRLLLLGPFPPLGHHLWYPISAGGCLLLSLALQGVDWRTRQGYWPAQFLGVLLIPAFALIGLAVGPRSPLNALPTPTIAGFCLLSVALLCSRPTWALGGLLARRSQGARLRKAILVVLLMSSVAGYFIARFLLTNTHLTWVEFSVLAIFSISLLGGFVAWEAVVAARIEEQRRQARELRELLAAVVDSSDDAIISQTLDARIVAWNRGAEKVFGYPAAEVVGQSILMLRPPDRLDEMEGILARISAGESVKHFETVRLRKDGSSIDVSATISPVRNGEGTIVGASMVARDISEHKRAEEALRDSEERFQTLANGIHQLAWMAEADGFIFWYNQRWYEYTGATLEQMKGWGWQQVHDPEVLPEVLERWTASIATGQPFEMEFPLRGADGHFREFLTRIRPMKDAQGAVVRWFGTNTDISERKQAEQRLAAQTLELSQKAEELIRSRSALEAQKRMLATRTTELEAANRELHAFTYSVSHDLRAPLRHIGGFSRILLEDFGPQMPAGARDHLERIADSVRRAGLMVDGLLSLARLGRQSLTPRVTPFNEVVDEVIAILEPECEGRSVEWRIGALPAVECDQVLIGQVFQNLLSNALKYSRRRDRAVIEIDSIQESGKPAVIYVRDNGAGFSMKYADKLFGVFQRLHTESEFEGTGVGLATAYRIIEKHGGSLWAEAEIDQGATFYFTVSAIDPKGMVRQAASAEKG